jgi:hypothetical protein
VAAQKDRKSELRLKLVTPKGQTQEVSQDKIAVFAPRASIAGENVVTRDARVTTGPKLVPIQEYIGKVQDLPVEVQKEAFESFEEVAPPEDLPVAATPVPEVVEARVPAAVKAVDVTPPKPELRFEALDLSHLETFELRPVNESRIVEIRPTLSESLELKELPRVAALTPSQIPEIPIQPTESDLIELKEEAKPVPTPVITAQPIVDEPVAPNLAVPPIEKPVVLAPLVPEIPSPDLKPEPVPNKTPVPSETAAASSSDGEGDSEVVEQEVVRRPSKTQFEKPPEGNDLSRSLYMERAGKKDVARRLRARAITKEGYSNNFEIVRTVLEDQVASALESSDCDGAGSVLDNAKNAFPKDPSVDRWMAQMRNRIRRQCKID